MSRASKNGDSLDPDEFMIHISKLVEEEIEECVDNIKKGLLKKKDPEMTEESLREVSTSTLFVHSIAQLVTL